MAISKKVLDRISRSLVRYRDILISARKRDVSESDTVVIIGDMMADVLGYENTSRFRRSSQSKARM